MGKPKTKISGLLVKELIEQEERKKDILQKDDYLEWLESFTIAYPSFSDEDKNFSEKFPKHIKDISLLFDIINNYARSNYINDNCSEEYPSNVEYNFCAYGNGYTIGLIIGQVSSNYIIRNDKIDKTFIDFNDIRNGVRTQRALMIDRALLGLETQIQDCINKGVPTWAIKERTSSVLTRTRK